MTDAACQLILGDSMEVMATLDPGSVDAVITDPPYGTASATKIVKRGAKLQTFDLAWDRELPLEWIPMAARALAPGGSFLAFTGSAAVSYVWQAVQSAGLRPLQCVYWRKLNWTPQPRQNFCSAVEVAVFARKPGRIRYWGAGGATPNVIESPIALGAERTAHPTQKPRAVMEWLVQALAKPGGIVLDPFAGSGTTGVAAIRLGRKFLGIERDPDYYAIAQERLQRVNRGLSRKDCNEQGTLFQDDDKETT